MESSHLIVQITLLFILMFAISRFLKRFGVPSIISFLLVGFLAKGWITHESGGLLEIFKEAGIILLFFFLGLEYSFERLKGMVNIWKPGVIDLAFNLIPVFLIALAFGFDPVTALIIAGVFYPSSTSIVAKLLMDFRRLASPEAELLIGILIFEDLVSIILISVLTPMVEAGGLDIIQLPLSALKMAVVLFAFYMLHRFGIPRIRSWLDRSSEDETFVFFMLGLLLLVGISFKELGLSEALGAFLLGVLVPETRVMENIERHLSAFKELSIGVFFFFFAYESDLSVPRDLGLLMLLALLGVVLKVVSTYLGAWAFGLRKKARLRASLSFVARGEFSVVIASLEPSVKILSIPFIFFTAVVGSLLFAVAPKVADLIYPPKRKGRSRFSQAQIVFPQGRPRGRP
ncbi:MAG: cation:proton antiporter [Aquificota bacterium]|nr:cation:proton antiporter [Aquificota bacterium]